MYTVYFLIGFLTSFGWWSAGKIQKKIDTSIIEVMEKKETASDGRKETSFEIGKGSKD